MHNLFDRCEHSSFLRVFASTDTHSDELIDLLCLAFEVLRRHSDEVQELIEPVLSLCLEESEQEVLYASLRLVVS